MRMYMTDEGPIGRFIIIFNTFSSHADYDSPVGFTVMPTHAQIDVLAVDGRQLAMANNEKKE